MQFLQSKDKQHLCITNLRVNNKKMLHYCYLSFKNNETALIIRSGSSLHLGAIAKVILNE